jgi:hypothetical protein
MDLVGVMVAYLPVVCMCVCVLHSVERHSVGTGRLTEQNAAICKLYNFCQNMLTSVIEF